MLVTCVWSKLLKGNRSSRERAFWVACASMMLDSAAELPSLSMAERSSTSLSLREPNGGCRTPNGVSRTLPARNCNTGLMSAGYKEAMMGNHIAAVSFRRKLQKFCVAQICETLSTLWQCRATKYCSCLHVSADVSGTEHYCLFQEKY